MLWRGFEIREGFEEWVLKLNMRGFMGVDGRDRYGVVEG